MAAARSERWSGGAGFVLATIGSAVGLGSIWKFPYEVGSNGGSVFVLFYLIGLALIVVPLMLAELAIGRRGQSDARASVANDLDPSSGPGLLFVTLPLAFAAVPFGMIAATVFFVLLVLTAIASAISLLEMSVALTRRAFGWSRPLATLVCAGVCWIAGFASVLSFNAWATWFPLAALPSFAKSTVFDLLDHLTSNVMLPIAGFALALFVGWSLPSRFLVEELQLGGAAAAIVRVLLRYVAPVAIAAVGRAPLIV